MSSPDAVPIDAGLELPECHQSFGQGLKSALALLLLFLAVVSDAFITHVLSGFGDKAVRGRAPTPWGVVLQGIFLVLMFTMATYLVDRHVI